MPCLENGLGCFVFLHSPTSYATSMRLVRQRVAWSSVTQTYRNILRSWVRRFTCGSRPQGHLPRLISNGLRPFFSRRSGIPGEFLYAPFLYVSLWRRKEQGSGPDGNPPILQAVDVRCRFLIARADVHSQNRPVARAPEGQRQTQQSKLNLSSWV